MKKPKKRSYRRLTEAQWAEAKELWMLGTATLEDLSRSYGVRGDTLSKRFKAEGIEKGSKATEHAEAVAKEAAERIKADSVEKIGLVQQRIQETNETYYRLHAWLTKRLVKIIQDADSGGRALEAEAGNIKALKISIEALELSHAARRKILKMDDPNQDPGEIPHLVVKELTDEEAAAIAAAQGVTEQDLGGLSEKSDEEGDIVLGDDGP